MINAFLILLIIYGVFESWKLQSKLSKLKNETSRLTKQFGDLEVTDPSMIHIRAISTGEPLHFAWRVYLPANYNGQNMLKTGGGTSTSSGSSSQPDNFVARVRFYMDENGNACVYETWRNGSGKHSIGSKSFLEFLKAHAQELKIEQAGLDETKIIKPGQTLPVLRIELPSELIEQHPEVFSDESLRYYIPELLLFRLD